MQFVNKELYHQMVDQLGIEEAYKQRFRGTGRTTRDILRLALMMSEGKKVHIAHRNKAGKRLEDCKHVIRQVRTICDYLGMHYEVLGAITLHFPQSGARITTFNFNSGLAYSASAAEGWELYELHDC